MARAPARPRCSRSRGPHCGRSSDSTAFRRAASAAPTTRFRRPNTAQCRLFSAPDVPAAEPWRGGGLRAARGGLGSAVAEVMPAARESFVAAWSAYLDDLDDALMGAGRDNLVLLAMPGQRRLL